MGCVFPKPVALNENTALPFFKVINIDQDGNHHLPGKIEITEEDLILYQKKKDPISWPIRTLRRYGYDREIFSFEAGRRCPTGEGIFAFHCDHAEQLFRLLQLNIQRSSSNVQNGHVDFLTSGTGYLEPRTTTRHESVGSQSSGPQTPVSPPVPYNSIYTFEPKSSTDSVAATPTSRPGSVLGSPMYMNVPHEVDEGEAAEEPPPNGTYLYLSGKYERPPPLSLPITPYEAGRDEPSPGNLQYITLELGDGPSSPSTRMPASEDGRSPGYTTIDFQKTWALVQSMKPNAEYDRGCTRRTRHNSTLSGYQ